MKTKITKDLLEELYIKKMLTTSEIGKITGYCGITILSYLKKFKIDIRNAIDYKNKDISGVRFGKLIVKQKIENKNLKNNAVFWQCQCDCGNTIVVKITSLTRKRVISCGCVLSQCKNPLFTGYGDLSGNKWNAIKKGALNRNLSFNLTIEEAWSLFQKQNGKCAISGVKIILGNTYERDETGVIIQSASLDRINSNNGYEIGNVQWIHKSINKIKNRFTDMELIRWAKLVDQNNP